MILNSSLVGVGLDYGELKRVLLHIGRRTSHGTERSAWLITPRPPGEGGRKS